MYLFLTIISVIGILIILFTEVFTITIEEKKDDE